MGPMGPALLERSAQERRHQERRHFRAGVAALVKLCKDVMAELISGTKRAPAAIGGHDIGAP